MAAITTAVVSVAATAYSVNQTKKAQQSAANQQQEAAAQSADLIASAGAAGEKDILAAQQAAANEIRLGAAEAQGHIEPYAAAAPALDQAKALTMSGASVGGGIGEAIQDAALQAGNKFPVGSSPVMQNAINDQAGLAVSAATPAITANLMNQGNLGLGALSDIAAIRQRGFNSLSDLASSSSTGRASTLVGQTPGLLQLANAGGEARMLSQIASTNAKARAGKSLAKLAGGMLNV